MKLQRLISQMIVGLLFLALFVSGCIKSSESDTENSNAQQMVTPEATNNHSIDPTTFPKPQPTFTTTPTPNPSPTVITSQLPEIFRSNKPLGVQFNISPFANLIHSPDQGNSILITHPYRQNKINIFDAENGEPIKTISYEADNIHYGADSSLIVIAKTSNELTTVEAHNIFSDVLEWRVDLPSVTFLEDVVLFNNSVLILDRPEFNEITFYLLDRTTGNLLWQKQHPCSWPHSLQIVQGTIDVDCDDSFLFLDQNNGDYTNRIEVKDNLDDTSTIKPTVSGTIKVYIRKSREPRDGIQVKNTYLEAVKLDSDEIIWSILVPPDVWDFSVYDSDIIYRTGKQLFRLNPITQEIIWQIVLLSEVQTTLLSFDNFLLVGSHAGYLHLVDVETGSLLWEQDIWATIEPRVVYIDPLAIVGNSVILFTEKGTISLGLDGNYSFELPTPRPRSTPIPTPTQTPQPIFTPPPTDFLPPAPLALSDWPAALTAFLNGQTENLAQLNILFEKWETAEYFVGRNGNFEWEEVDLTGNGRNEILIRISVEDYVTSGWVIILRQNQDNIFEIAYARQASSPQFLATTDLNNDGIIDFIYSETLFGASSSATIIYPVGWNGQEFENLTSESISSSNVRPESITIEDITGNGNLEIILQGGTYGSAAAGPNRNSIFTYAWSDSGYILLLQEPVLPQEYFFFLVEANQLLTSGEIEEAIAIFENSMFSEDALYSNDHQLAFAEFQLMLAHLMLDNEETAAVWAESGNYPEQLYSEAKEIFWINYQETHDWTTSAEAARKRIRMGGYEGAQLVSWVGYANTPLMLEDLCPCANCLQGTLGSPHYP